MPCSQLPSELCPAVPSFQIIQIHMDVRYKKALEELGAKRRIMTLVEQLKGLS
eukprot:SM008125S22607  [mRNA]  locus=s8125:2:355:- [translate_table: standard]